MLYVIVGERTIVFSEAPAEFCYPPIMLVFSSVDFVIETPEYNHFDMLFRAALPSANNPLDDRGKLFTLIHKIMGMRENSTSTAVHNNSSTRRNPTCR